MSMIPYYMVNEVMGCSKNETTPKVGMLGTYFVGSDRYAVVVAKVFSPKKIFAIDVDESTLSNKRVDENGIEWLDEETVAKILNDITPNRSWYEGMPENEIVEVLEFDTKRFNRDNTYTFRKNGRWVEEGQSLWDCSSIHLGVADPYRDPDF